MVFAEQQELVIREITDDSGKYYIDRCRSVEVFYWMVRKAKAVGGNCNGGLQD